jgi:polysaccharide deacetylase family sporulation protein PdaB
MKCLVITKKQLTIFCSVVLAFVMVLFGGIGASAKSDKKLPIYCTQTDEKKVALSFDAAWGNDDTEELIKILAEYDAVATFFVVGAWVDKYPESVKQLSDAGHQIHNHSNTHPHMPQLSREQMLSEITACNEKIDKITGKTPNLIRVPYGDYNNSVIETVEKAGMYTIQWDVDSLDWKDSATAESICKRVVGKVKNGSIVLFHNDAEFTPEALPNILKCLKEQGYEFVFIDDLILKDNYEIKHDGTQCKIKNDNTTQ